MTGDRREQFRAIFLAAIMVISMVGLGVGGLAGSAVADDHVGADGPDISGYDEPDPDEFDYAVFSDEDDLEGTQFEGEVETTAFDNVDAVH